MVTSLDSLEALDENLNDPVTLFGFQDLVTRCLGPGGKIRQGTWIGCVNFDHFTDLHGANLSAHLDYGHRTRKSLEIQNLRHVAVRHCTAP